ncbi:MAG: hypothetical protein OSB45_11195, partial [Pseudomonadales bacterium]|nr:hypothetical protein [Pseudomonadales bacterium]
DEEYRVSALTLLDDECAAGDSFIFEKWVHAPLSYSAKPLAIDRRMHGINKDCLNCVGLTRIIRAGSLAKQLYIVIR